MTCTLAFLGMGGTEIVVILVVVLLLFGPKKLPELAKGLGQGIREFKRASNEVTEELHRAAEEQPATPPKKLPPEGTAARNDSQENPPSEPAHKPQ